MAARAAIVLMLLALVCGGCAASHTQPGAAPQAAMPLTGPHLSQLRAALAQAKAHAPKPVGKDDYVRYARQVYVASWTGDWSAAATTAVALDKAKSGDALAREYLTLVVYDLPLQAAMEGVGFPAEDWRDIYVASGIMDAATFSGYAAMSRGGKVLP